MALAIVLPVVVVAAIMLWGAVVALVRVARWLWRMLVRPDSFTESGLVGRDIFGDY